MKCLSTVRSCGNEECSSGSGFFPFVIEDLRRKQVRPWCMRMAAVCLGIVAGAAPVWAQAVSEEAGGRGRPALSAADQSYFAANGFLNRGQDDLAKAEYESFLREHGDHQHVGAARYGLAVASYRLRDYDAVVGALSPVFNQDGYEFAVEGGLILGRTYQLMGKYAEAVGVLETTGAKASGHKLARDLQAALIEAYLGKQSYAKALAAAETFRNSWPESIERGRVEFFAGRAAMALSKWSSAAPAFQFVAKRHADDVFGRQARIYLARCYHEDGQWKKAAAVYQNAIELASPEVMPDLLLGLGVVQRAVDAEDEAAATFKKLIDGYPASALVTRARYECGHCLFSLGRYEDATRMFAGVSGKKSALEEEALFWQSRSLLLQGREGEAAERMAGFLETFPASDRKRQVQYDLAAIWTRAGDFDRAKALLLAVVDGGSTDALTDDAMYVLMTQLHAAKDWKGSLEWSRRYTKTFDKGRHLADANFLVAENLFLREQYPAAVKAWRTFLTRHGDDARKVLSEFRLGLSLLRSQQADEAVQLLGRLTNVSQSEVRHGAQIELGSYYFQRGEWKRCQELLVAAMDELGDGVDPNICLQLGIATARLGDDDDRALAYLDRYVSKATQGEGVARAQFERGQLLLKMGDSKDARRAFERAAKQDDDSELKAHALHGLGRATMLMDQPADAAAYYKQAASLSGNGALQRQADFQSAVALFDAGELREALDSFRVLCDTMDSSTSPEVFAYRALCAAKTNECAEADRAMKDIAASGHSAAVTELLIISAYERAWCHRRKENSDRAERAYDALLAFEPDHRLKDRGALELAGLLEQREAYRDAFRVLNDAGTKLRAVAEPVRSQYFYRLGINAYRLAEYKEAIAALGEVKLEPTGSAISASTRFYLAQAHEADNDPRRAAEVLGQLVEVAGGDVDASLIEASLLKLGDVEASRQHWPQSERAFQSHRERFPKSDRWFQSQFGLAWAREQQQRFDQAIAAYRRVVESHQGVSAARAQFQIGECLFAQKKYEDAVRELLKVDILFAYPEWSAGALFEAGRCYELLGRHAEAKKLFEQVASSYAESDWGRMASSRISALNARSEIRVPGRGTD